MNEFLKQNNLFSLETSCEKDTKEELIKLYCQILRPALTPTIYDKLYTALGLIPSLLRPNTTYDLITSAYEAPYGTYSNYPSG